MSFAVYKVDVELDQIMTYFFVPLSNICAYFLKEFLQLGPLSFSTLMQSVLLLNGEIEETHEQRKVILIRNLKEPELMKKLEKALIKLNARNDKLSQVSITSFFYHDFLFRIESLMTGF